MSRPWIKRVVFLLVSPVLVFFSYHMLSPNPHSACVLEQAAYVWQYDWAPAVEQAVARSADTIPLLMVMTGEVDGRSDQPALQTVRVNWDALTGRNATIVLRGNVAVLRHMRASVEIAAAFFAEQLQQSMVSAQKAKAIVQGVQLDMDCPTADLAVYASFLHALRAKLPNTPLSITTLPTWLDQSTFANVVKGLDYFVLQVHFLDKPKTVEDPITLCNVKRVPRWMEKASALGVPYYVALPTYGYRVYFDAHGGYAGIGAEASPASMDPARTREVRADPQAMAGLVRGLKAELPKHCKGIVWFRLPVEGDMLNWSWPVLQQVMNGEAPPVQVVAEVKNPSENLYEVWVNNQGAYRPNGNIRIPVHLSGGTLGAYDVLGGFKGSTGPDNNDTVLVGPAPAPGQSAMAAWFRFKDANGGSGIEVKTDRVEMVQ